jgi:hypothetical protein
VWTCTRISSVICGANFTYLQVGHQFTLRTRTFEASPLTESSLDLRLFIRGSRQSPRSPNRVSAFTAEVKFFNISEVSIAIISRTYQVLFVLKQETDMWYSDHSAIVSHNLRGLMNHIKIMKHIHERFHVTKQTCDSVTHFRNSPKSRLSRSFKVKGFYLFPTPTTLARMIDYL